MSSSRLPGKVLLDIAGKSMLERVIERASTIQGIDTIIVATTTDAEDDPIAFESARLGIESFRGHPTDVLDRFYQAASAHGADAIVRITADCPLLDPAISGLVIEQFLSTKSDYCSNVRPPTYPDGLDTEVLTYQALEKCWNDAELESDREHVATYIRRTQSEQFNIHNTEHSVDLSGTRWTVDEPQDLEFMQALIPELEHRHGPAFGLDDIQAVLNDMPEIASLNETITRNEGWSKSLSDDNAANTPN
jgi:spore coat polysaccharide biosynthesis protein SpsF